MCKDAVNRALVFLEVYVDRRLRRAFLIEAINCIKWEEPELTDMLKERMNFYKELSNEIDKVNESNSRTSSSAREYFTPSLCKRFFLYTLQRCA